MDSVLYSWLAAAAVAPFVVMLSCWTLAVFRSYRSDWRLLDIFLYALTCLEVSSSLFGFGYAILGAIRPDLEAPCLFLVWGLTATRVFHLSTVTSLLLDRALACKWPQKYLSSVRHSQVRYHIIVLGVISVFVGVTSVFARLPPAATSPRHCSLHPLDWDVKFSAFLACVYGMLLITGFGCCLVVQAGRFRSRTSYRTTSFSRDSATSRSTASCEESRDLEWAVAASVCWLAYMNQTRTARPKDAIQYRKGHLFEWFVAEQEGLVPRAAPWPNSGRDLHVREGVSLNLQAIHHEWNFVKVVCRKFSDILSFSSTAPSPIASNQAVSLVTTYVRQNTVRNGAASRINAAAQRPQ
ncbi:hypothetical protein JTE90_023178 [Oedothorax gibbosus]|uniref:G-protein coupled receptors family 1 profile domain-containing protein n=1 Tax=Oedothorax gibbosus TaxID=931172 RepID=A0AAV6UH78_9ARAC|nr:hypothetical protein JTE90_023178 [Oedothorax gibbosus]